MTTETPEEAAERYMAERHTDRYCKLLKREETVRKEMIDRLERLYILCDDVCDAIKIHCVLHGEETVNEMLKTVEDAYLKKARNVIRQYYSIANDQD